jgi:lipopolysaccharide export LptBFGC system permease protein LptF
VTILYLMLFKVTGAAGNTGALPPQIAAWIPNVLFGLAAIVLLGRVRT